MKTNILFRVPGLVALEITGPKTFDLKGDPIALAQIQELAPVLQPTGNALHVAADVIGRLLYLEAADVEERPRPGTRLTSHDDLQRLTCTENPLVLFQTRHPAVAQAISEMMKVLHEDDDTTNEGEKVARWALEGLEAAWQTEGVFLDPVEAKRWVDAQEHRFPAELEGKAWRIHTGIARGHLATVARETRELANL